MSILAGDRVHRYWITRRAAIMIGNGLNDVLKEQYDLFGLNSGIAHHAKELADFGQTAALDKYPLKSHNPEILTVGATPPLLIYQMRYGEIKADLAKIAFMDKMGNGFSYTILRDHIHALLNLIQSQSDKANWQVQVLKTHSIASSGSKEDRAFH